MQMALMFITTLKKPEPCHQNYKYAVDMLSLSLYLFNQIVREIK